MIFEMVCAALVIVNFGLIAFLFRTVWERHLEKNGHLEAKTEQRRREITQGICEKHHRRVSYYEAKKFADVTEIGGKL